MLPPPAERSLLMQCGVLAARKGAPLAVIDDDPTGTQTVHSVPVLADWSVDTLQARPPPSPPPRCPPGGPFSARAR